QQQQWTQTQPVQQPRTQPRVNEQPQTRTVQSAPAQPARQSQPPKQTASQQPYQDLLQTPAHTSAAAPKAAPITRAPEAPKATAEKKDERRWMVQCGSFKGAEQAESVRAQLAFEGFDSKITTNNGWNRVVIGPVKGKENADSTINRLKMAGHTNCIRLATGG
ncbi:TPA: cell division protein FtsN, partial [Salmonella enterica subsp. enterica serovar Paratyphi C]|nr:cell division protein FtsN [Salmonella enterica subsp. enterica serovar Paratyphi C]